MPVLPEEDGVLSISGDCQLQHRARGGFSEWLVKTIVEDCQGAGAPLTESGLASYLGHHQQLLEEGKSLLQRASGRLTADGSSGRWASVLGDLLIVT